MEVLEGRDTDLAIAQQVFGLEWREWKPYYSPEGWYRKEFRGRSVEGYLPVEAGYQSILPFYSYDLADAWTVVEHLRSLGYTPTIIGLDHTWNVAFDKTYIIEADNSSLPEAICRAALETLKG